MTNLFKYRPDIDGLRAIAVLLVLFFHAKFSFISGGFVGVDVFFVISGFLITTIIQKEVLRNSFSYKTFYLRRIKRIAPALIALLLITSIFSYLFLFPRDFEIFARNLIHAFLTTSNFFLWQNTGGYFSPNTDLFPLLHTWSLAVEEQFYFIWPVLFIFLAKLTKQKHLGKICLLACVGLLGLSIHLANTSPHSAYFLLPARAFELMIGALLAITYTKLPAVKTNLNHILSIIGLSLIVIPSLLISKASVFPGLNALWPCLGTALLIISGKNSDSMGVVNRIMSYKHFVFIGLISYSLYLWHWPIFTYIQYLGLELEGALRIAAIILAIVLAYLSYRFVEQPIRYANLPTFGSAMKKIMLPAFIILTVIYGVVDVKNGFPHRFNELAEFDKKNNFPSTVRKQCFDADLIGNIEDCWLGTKKEKLDGVLIGDSFANHSASLIDVFAKDANLYLHDSTSGGHPILTRMHAPGQYDYPPKYANDRLEYALQFEHIILAANWDYYSNPNNINYEYLLKTIADILKHNKKVSVVISIPATTKEHLHRMKLAKGGRFVFFDDLDTKIDAAKYPHNHIVNEMKRRFPNIHYIDLNDVLCDESKCDLVLNDTILYRNSDHFNTSGAAMIGEKYLKEIGNPLIF